VNVQCGSDGPGGCSDVPTRKELMLGHRTSLFCPGDGDAAWRSRILRPRSWAGAPGPARKGRIFDRSDMPVAWPTCAPVILPAGVTHRKPRAIYRETRVYRPALWRCWHAPATSVPRAVRPAVQHVSGKRVAQSMGGHSIGHVQFACIVLYDQPQS